MTETQAPWRGKTFQALVQEAKAKITEITLDDLKSWQAAGKSFVMLDVREASDFAASHIPSALSLPRGILELEIDELVPDQDTVIVAYCGGGSRSALAADTLQQMGYTHIYSLAKGFRGWSAEAP